MTLTILPIWHYYDLIDRAIDDVSRIFDYDKYCTHKRKGQSVCGCSNSDDVNGTGNLARAQLTDVEMSSVGAPPLAYLITIDSGKARLRTTPITGH